LRFSAFPIVKQMKERLHTSFRFGSFWK
jgi:hypothetical protein